MTKDVKVIPMDGTYGRYVVIDAETQKVLDDAQGYGYRTPQKAHAAWNYKHRTPKQSKSHSKNLKFNKDFVKKHKDVFEDLAQIQFEIAKGSWEPNDKFDYALFKKFFEENKIEFSGNLYSLFCYFQKCKW